jgi:hypothetical protein
MKIRILFAMLFVTLFIFQPALADDDICQLAGRAVGMDAQGVDSFFQTRVQGFPVRGSGTVSSVMKEASDDVEGNYTVVMDCGNKVQIFLQAGSFWIYGNDIRPGGPITFRGVCVGIEQIEGLGLKCIVKGEED